MWAVLFSDGAVCLDDINQIRDERWVPIAAIRRKDNLDSPSTVLLFHDRDTAYKFTRRNLKQLEWLKGGVELTDDDVNDIKKKHKVEELSFPKRFDCHPDYELTYEIIGLCDKPDVKYVKAKV